MLLFVLGLVLFFAIHLVPAVPATRAGLADRFGENAYKGIFSLISLAGLALIIYGWHKLQMNPGKNPVLWVPPVWTKHVAFTLMLPASVFLVAAYVPSRIRTAVRHPMLVAIKLWALAHLLANGDLAGVVLFTSFLAYAVFDRISLKRRPGGGLGPLGAAKGGLVGDVIVVLAGSAFWAFMLLWGHQHLIGKALIATSLG